MTSPTGAAVRDILTTLKRRYPIAQITLLPALVQGDQAPASIVRAIMQADAAGVFDVLIAGRAEAQLKSFGLLTMNRLFAQLLMQMYQLFQQWGTRPTSPLVTLYLT